MTNDKLIADLLKSQLKDAEDGKIMGLIVVRVDHNGGLSYAIQAPQAIPVAILGAMDWAKDHVLFQSREKTLKAAAEQQEAEASK